VTWDGAEQDFQAASHRLELAECRLHALEGLDGAAGFALDVLEAAGDDPRALDGRLALDADAERLGGHDAFRPAAIQLASRR
jgi:hypothetical protein